MLPHLRRVLFSACLLLCLLLFAAPPAVQSHVANGPRAAAASASASASSGRQRSSLNAGWRFARFTTNPDSLSYSTLKQWIMPSANNFLSGTKYQRPSGAAPGSSVSYVQASFNDNSWQAIDLPHDWAVEGPFNAPGIPGEMGRLPSNGVGWYRRNVTISANDIAAGRSVFLDIDGAMSYTAVWINGYLVGGWPYGYNSFRLDLTQHVTAGNNLLAIRLDNALSSSRFYPGAGLYRNVWLVIVDAIHIGQYGTFITTPTVTSESASLHLTVQVENQGSTGQQVNIHTQVYEYDPVAKAAIGSAVATFPQTTTNVVAAGTTASVNTSTTITNPLLWGPAPAQKPNLYIAVTTLSNSTNAAIDTYNTSFGIRSITYDPNKGVLVNGQGIRLQGTCNHHDLGSLGSAFNVRAAERQLQMLQEMGSNALRTSHNPPAPEFLDLADQLGFVVLDEIFDCWSTAKRTNDFHLIFSDWHEPDLRTFVRRDRNHPSVIAWSVGNEIPEQNTAAGGAIAQQLRNIARGEDLTRPVTLALSNEGSPSSITAQTMDILGMNYQGEGSGTTTVSSFPKFRSGFPNKMIFTTESASTVSSRGIYTFPVTSGNNAIVGSGSGEDSSSKYVSDYGLYSEPWGSSPDKVFLAQDKYSYVAGEFVWTGWDYIGEPDPYDASRSSYFGIIDMIGAKKDRFYLYQSRWRPDLPMAHILPHWTWPDRVGQVTPVHVFSSADSAELFVNGKSAGMLKATSKSNYRFRWDKVTYSSGNLRVVTYKNGVQWAVDTVTTAGSATRLNMTADRSAISVGVDLSFLSVAVVDSSGVLVPRSSNTITFSVSGPGKIVTTDNGDPTDFTVFQSSTRKAFSGQALAIVRATGAGTITVSATASGLTGAQVALQAS